MKKIYKSLSVLETIQVGQVIGSELEKGITIALQGTLGSGKTTLVKGIAKGLGVQQEITSPTFSIIQEYEASIPLYHIDLYRLKDYSEIEDLGLEEYLYGDGVTIIEWPELILHLLPSLTIFISIIISDNSRIISIEKQGI